MIQLSERVLEALRDLGSGRHLVVTHGGVIRLLVGRAGVTRYPDVGSVSCMWLTLKDGDARALGVLFADDLGLGADGVG